MWTELVTHVTAAIEQLRRLLQGVPGLETVASAPYLFRPFVMLMLLGLASGLVGVIVNLRCLEFNAEATVHSIFPGIVAGALFSGIDHILLGASVAAVCVALALTIIGRDGKPNEAGTAVVLTSFFSLGVVLSLKKGDMSGQLEALMFGRLLEVSNGQLVQSMAVCLLALAVIGVSWRAQFFRAFDATGSRALGISGVRVDIAANAAIAAVVVAASSAVGVLLVIGYLVVPGAAARLVARRTAVMVPVAVAMGCGGGYLGMLVMNLDSSHPISPQAAVALSVVGLYLVILAAREATQWDMRRMRRAHRGRAGSAVPTAHAPATREVVA